MFKKLRNIMTGHIHIIIKTEKDGTLVVLQAVVDLVS